MKRWFIASLTVLVGSVFLVAAIEHDPGYLLLSYGHYTLESSVWIGLLAFVLLFALVYGFFSLLRRGVNTGNALSQWVSGRRNRSSQQQTTQGLIAFIEGNWQQSRRILTRAAANSETPLVNYLVAARASHAMGDASQTKELLKLAEKSTSGASTAVGLTQAELQLHSGQLEQSLATLMRVRRNMDKHPHVLELLRSVYVRLNEWQEVLALIPELKKHKVVNDDELQQLELTASKNSILEASRSRKNSLQEMIKLWQQLPKTATKNSDVVACYAREIMAAGDMVQAEKLIRNQLKREWNKSLIHLYGLVQGEDSGKQLIHAESWLQERNSDAALLLCLGRLSLRNSLWGKAREYFEHSRKLEASSEVCAELGRLLAHLGEHEKSNAYFEQGLMLATDGLPALPMPPKRQINP